MRDDIFQIPQKHEYNNVEIITQMTNSFPLSLTNNTYNDDWYYYDFRNND